MYRKLKGLLFENDIDQKYLCTLFKAPNGKPRSHFYVTERMTGKRAWDTDEIYIMCDLLGIPYDQIHIYFPRGGRDSKQSPKKQSEAPKYIIRRSIP